METKDKLNTLAALVNEAHCDIPSTSRKRDGGPTGPLDGHILVTSPPKLPERLHVTSVPQN